MSKLDELVSKYYDDLGPNSLYRKLQADFRAYIEERFGPLMDLRYTLAAIMCNPQAFDLDTVGMKLAQALARAKEE